MKLVQRLKRSSFARSFSVVFSGAALAQILAFALAPVLSRLYDPELFGLFGVFMSVGGTVGTIACLRYEQAIMLVEHDSEAVSLLNLSLKIALAMAGLTTIGVAIAWYVAPELLAGIETWLWIVGTFLLVSVSGGQVALQVYAARRKRFRFISFALVARTLTTTVAQCLVSAWQTAGLVAGTLLGLVAGSLPFIGLLRDKPQPVAEQRSVRELAREYADFPKYNAPRGLINSLTQNAPVVILALIAGPASAGAYTMTVRLLQRPLTVISGPLRQVFYQHSSELYRTSPAALNRLYRKTTLALAAAALIPSLIVIAVGPWLFEIVLGAEWTEAGQQSQWLILWLALLLVNVPAVVLTRVLRMEREMLGYDLGLLVFRLAAIGLGTWWAGPLIGVALYSLVGVVFNLFLIMWIDRKSQQLIPTTGGAA